MQQQAKPLPPPSSGSPISSMAPFLASTTGPHTLASANPLHPPALAVAEVAAPILPPTKKFEDDEEADRCAAPGNRWPRQETVVLLKIRSEMDIAFREATLKGPLWEEVSRKMAELGYKRSASKCREKFDNVQKYYKRTKEARAGRHDAKTYRFFSQLEALHNSTGGDPTTKAAAAAAAPSTVITFAPATAALSATTNIIQPLPLSAMAPSHLAIAVPDAAVWWRNSSSPSQSDEDGSEDRGLNGEGRQKRKRHRVDGRRMMGFFEGLAKQVMDRQEAMHRRFMEAIERREQDRSIREEAWRRQELALRCREQELLAQERSTTAARDAALISYLQKIGGAEAAPVPLPTIPAATFAASIRPIPPLPSPKPPISQALQSHSSPPNQKHGEYGNGSLESPTSSSRWPKAEVHALIKIRSVMETQYQEAGPKGPLWEEISVGMRRLGYDRSAKRCKEKWENINKYFKKVKDGGKQRAEDGKTCPYYHQLDALYRKKQNGNVPAEATKRIPLEAEGKINGNNCDGGPERVQTSNGDHAAPGLFEDGTKADLVGAMNGDCDNMDGSEAGNLNQLDAEEDEEASSNMEYETEIQRQSVNGGGSNDSTSAAAAATTGSFVAMVQ